MICPECGGENVTISMEEVGSKTKKRELVSGATSIMQQEDLWQLVHLECLIWSGRSQKERPKPKRLCKKYVCVKIVGTVGF